MKLAKSIFIIITHICLLTFETSGNYKYDLALCAIFQNQARFMKEWIEFHKLVGVQHFYLYNNFSTDNYLEILKSYLDKGEVELNDWEIPRIRGITDCKFQCSAYNDALRKAWGIVKWVAFLDLDEYLFPMQEDNLLNFLKDYEEYGGVAINWVMYGTSNIECIPENELIIEHLTMCNPNHSLSTLIKSIVRPERVVRFVRSPHFPKYKHGYSQVTPNKIPFRGAMSPYSATDKLRLNHYWLGDIKYLLEVKIPRNIFCFTGEHEYAEQLLIIEEHLNEDKKCTTRDVAIHKYLDRLKMCVRAPE